MAAILFQRILAVVAALQWVRTVRPYRLKTGFSIDLNCVKNGAEMKRLTLLFAIGLIAGHAHAMSGVTKGGHTACLTKEWLNDVVSFVVANDKASFKAYLDSKKCIILKSGIQVTVTESPGMFGGTVGFVGQGIKFWTVREALEYGN